MPPTDVLNNEAAKERAGLARQGSLAERQPPASLVAKRQQMNNGTASMASSSEVPIHDVSYEDDRVSIRILIPFLIFWEVAFLGTK